MRTRNKEGRKAIVILMAVALGFCSQSIGRAVGQEAQEDDTRSVWQRESLGGDLWGARSTLEEYGVSAGLGLTQVYQHNLHGGTEAGVGGYAGSYDLETTIDAGRAVGLEGGQVYMLGEGSTVSSSGVDYRAVSSLFGINDDMGGERALDITELWYQHNFWGGHFRIRVGKQDLTNEFICRGQPVAFDANTFAFDETAQFLNSSLVNNPVIPFPDYALGAVAYAEPVTGWYLSAGGVDADADPRTSGFETTFDGDSNFFYAAETGVVPIFDSDGGELPGAYRVGAWHEHKRRNLLNKRGQDGENTGFYASFNQLLWRETSGEPAQGLGIFGRAGYADPEVSEIETFGSAGLNYRGLVPGRKEDVVGLGVSHGEVSERAGLTADYERAAEMYYNAAVTPWLEISPMVQWIQNPGASDERGNAWVVGTRVQANF